MNPIRLTLALLVLLPLTGQAQDQYQKIARKIIEATLAENQAYDKLQVLCDEIGHRLSGSKGLEKAVVWAVATMKRDGHENVRTDKVMVPHWVRGKESLELLLPRPYKMPLLALGGSVGTPAEGITAEVVVVHDEQELAKLGAGAKGKIVLFNNKMPKYDPKKGSGYGRTVRFRLHGARLASVHGAVAILIRSVTATSLRSPHTGVMIYGNAKTKIPAAAISLEDADMLDRLYSRKKQIRVRLKMGAHSKGMAPSHNVLGELRGSTHPEQIVVIGGHLDSWDVGQGAHDDGTGVVIAMEALSVLRRLGLRPKRTIRVVLYTNEENGMAGAKAYVKQHAAEMANHVAGIESDSGGWSPLGFSLQPSKKSEGKLGLARLTRILALLRPIKATRASLGGSGADVGKMTPFGVPTLGLRVDGSKYFDHHHAHSDTLDKVDRKELTRCVAAMAVVAYVLADMPQKLNDPPK